MGYELFLYSAGKGAQMRVTLGIICIFTLIEGIRWPEKM